MTDSTDLLLNGGVFDPRECISSQAILNDLPLLNSERREYQNKIRQMKEDFELSQTTTLHRVNRIVLEADYLSDEIKAKLLEEIWK